MQINKLTIGLEQGSSDALYWIRSQLPWPHAEPGAVVTFLKENFDADILIKDNFYTHIKFKTPKHLTMFLLKCQMNT
jgi:hypothetical protein